MILNQTVNDAEVIDTWRKRANHANDNDQSFAAYATIKAFFRE